MPIIPEAGFEISDENSMALPRPVNRKRKRMNKPRSSIDKPRGGAAGKWTDDETSILINVLHDDARKHGFNGSTTRGPRCSGIWFVIMIMIVIDEGSVYTR
uniref:Uncharacterized protein n=2 Tax=Nicotiana TaxID=4085 RepID=A0A1S4ALG7_TOBAC|nr:PREDICTED: uncharacterized protein LOC104210931 [Nicotiana sylvestris]XP_016477288.1 PREDICTED: uncharacterized protein LOC107798770 [Nicotiana tabacum]